MTISYPLSLPSNTTARDATLRLLSSVGVSESPFSGAQQSHDWGQDRWAMRFDLPPMKRANAEEWIGGFLAALHGRRGSFLAGEPAYTTPQGTWSGGSPLVNGGSQSGEALNVDGLAAGATGKAGDYFQLGSGSSARLYKLTKDFTANGAGQAALDFTPKLRASPADNAALTLASPKGLFMLGSNDVGWTLVLGGFYKITFDAIEDLRGL